MKVAIVHDWLYGGGAERVVLELHRMYPDAPIYTSYCTDEWREKLDNKVVTGYLQNWPFSRLRKFLPLLRQYWFSRLNLSGYDLIISSSGNGEAKFARTKNGAKHICYCHTPTHFYWRHLDDYYKNPGFRPKWLARLGLRLLLKPLRARDYKAAQRVDHFIANSTHIQNDIKRFYGKEASVIHPPVDVERFNSIPSQKRHGFVAIGRLVPAKKTAIAVRACSELGLDLTVAGRGPELEGLKKIAGPSVTFDGNASDEVVANYMACAEAFIFASEEDFGITPVEAMAAGTPVLAYAAGGAMDYVVPGKTGEFFKEQTVASLVGCLKSFDSANYSADDIKKAAQRFSKDIFVNSMRKELTRILQ